MPRHLRALAALAAAFAGLPALAGPLTPPAGAVTSTGKTLQQVEPRIPIGPLTTPGDEDSVYKITQSGSYYLTGDIFAQSGKNGIEIAASHVTIDLCGYTAWGSVLTGASRNGVLTRAAQVNITIRNGQLVSWGNSGVDLLSTSENARVENVTVRGCSSAGIYISSGDITGCLASENGVGIEALGTSRIAGCVARRNGTGIRSGTGSIVESCVASDNEQDGIHAFSSGRVDGCTAIENGETGIRVCHSVVVTGNTVSVNGTDTSTGAGIMIDNGCVGSRIEDNHLTGNRYGMRITGHDCFVARNTARGNAAAAFSIVSGNHVAPIVTDPGSNGFATMTPWSNVAY